MASVEDSDGLNWDAMRPGLVRFLTRRTGCATTAEDLVQDLWLKVQGSTGVLSNIRNPAAYLFRAAANVAFDWRSRDIFPACQASELSEREQPVDEGPSPERLAQSRQASQLLAAAIEELPPKCRKAFLLCRVEGLTMREAGRKMGVSERTIENHLAKATLHCRRRLVEAGAWP